MSKVASSIVIGNTTSPDLAAEALHLAMLKADINVANSVLLFLTSEFASNPQPAIKAAAAAAHCTQIAGCTASGIFNEQEWVLDAPAAAAMVFGGNLHFDTFKHSPEQARLTLCAPNAINSTWLNNGYARFGGVAGDAIGQGGFSVWQNAKGEHSGLVEASFPHTQVNTGVSHGLQYISQPQRIGRCNHLALQELDAQPAFNALQKAWRFHRKTDEAPPLHLLAAVYADSADEIYTGNFEQTTIIDADEENGSITLAHVLTPGKFVCFGLRSIDSALADMAIMTQQLSSHDGAPDFGLMFSCLGRGPYFYDGQDRDLKIITTAFPNMPLLGFYGNAEIACINEKNQLLPYSTVLSIFSSQ